MSDMGMLHFYLGIQFVQNEKGIFMSQSKYVQWLLERFRLQDCKPISTPMEPGLKFSIHDGNENPRPDIQYAVNYHLVQGLDTALELKSSGKTSVAHV